MKLVVFDLDGTLTRTNDVDGECFVRAFMETLQLPEVNKTARNLGLSFLGIASGARALVLRDNGASHVIEDYLDPDRCLQYLNEAQAP